VCGEGRLESPRIRTSSAVWLEAKNVVGELHISLDDEDGVWNVWFEAGDVDVVLDGADRLEVLVVIVDETDDLRYFDTGF